MRVKRPARSSAPSKRHHKAVGRRQIKPCCHSAVLGQTVWVGSNYNRGGCCVRSEAMHDGHEQRARNGCLCTAFPVREACNKSIRGAAIGWNQRAQLAHAVSCGSLYSRGEYMGRRGTGQGGLEGEEERGVVGCLVKGAWRIVSTCQLVIVHSYCPAKSCQSAGRTQEASAVAARAGELLPFCCPPFCSPACAAAGALAPAGATAGLAPAGTAAFSGVQVGSKWLFRPSQHW